MSRIGKLPIEIKPGVQVSIEGDIIIAKGPKGELNVKLNNLVMVDVDEKEIKVSVKNPENKTEKSLWGLYRSLINNIIIGVTEGFEKKLEINGVGYKAQVLGKKLTLNLGYSNPIEFILPEGIDASVEANVITISGIDKHLVGEISAQIRKKRKPEPYKGKGIRYIDEVIIRKEGKSAAKDE